MSAPYHELADPSGAPPHGGNGHLPLRRKSGDGPARSQASSRDSTGRYEDSPSPAHVQYEGAASGGGWCGGACGGGTLGAGNGAGNGAGGASNGEGGYQSFGASGGAAQKPCGCRCSQRTCALVTFAVAVVAVAAGLGVRYGVMPGAARTMVAHSTLTLVTASLSNPTPTGHVDFLHPYEPCVHPRRVACALSPQQPTSSPYIIYYILY